jgi:hypothetical protein
MKSVFTICTVVMLFLVTTFTTSYAQNEWDYNVACFPSVLMVDNIYYMWYTGKSPAPAGSIGFASSSNGLDWDIYPENPVLVHMPFDGWDEATVYEPNVIHDDSHFRMWYTSSDDPLLPGPIHIHHATSPDGLIWSKDTVNNPVLSPGRVGSWDGLFVDSHCIIFVDSIYHMWYTGANGTYVRIGHATSPDGVAWTKDANNPVLSNGTAGSWDNFRVEGPNVIFDGTTYHMWYSGGSHSRWQIGYATSIDGVNWMKHADNPVLKLGSEGRWDDTWIGFCSVLLDTVTSTFRMWYSGGDIYLMNQTPWRAVSRIGHATSPDGFTWTKQDDPIVDDVDEAIHSGIPEKFILFQNYPNPFNPLTAIGYQLSAISEVDLSIYNLLGQKVATLVNRRQPAGYHQVDWNASGFASGVYYYRLSTNAGFVNTKKLMLIK